jgi:polyphenol oxidase
VHSVHSHKTKLKVLRAENLGLSRLVQGFSTRQGGFSTAYGGRALNLGFTKDDSRAAVERNRNAFLEAVGATSAGKTWPLVGLRQVHSDIIHLVEHATREPLAGDGLITRTPGLLLAVKTADCLPVLLADRQQRAVAVLHAGWRGTVKRIVEKAVGEFRRIFAIDPADVRAAIGPGIHACCYEVGEEVRDEFRSQFAYADQLFEERFSSDPVREKYPLLFLNMRAPGHGEPPRKLHLDLVEANRRQLLDAGVVAINIWASPLCTSCRTDILFSHRAEKGVTGRMMAVVGVKP